MGINKETTRKHMLSFDERLIIEKLWNIQQRSVSYISRYLDRPRTSIERELKRGNMLYFRDVTDTTIRSLKMHTRLKYSARYAQQFIDSNKIIHEYRHKLTPENRVLIEHELSTGLSPESIKKIHPELSMSAVTIRNYIKRGLIQNTSSKKLDTYKHNVVDNQMDDKAGNNGVSLVEYSKYWIVKLYADKKAYNRTAVMMFIECNTYYTVLIRIEDKTLFDYATGIRIFLTNFAFATKGLIITDNDYSIDDLTKLYPKINIRSFNLKNDIKMTERSNFILNFLPETNNLINVRQNNLDSISEIINHYSKNGENTEWSTARLFDKNIHERFE